VAQVGPPQAGLLEMAVAVPPEALPAALAAALAELLAEEVVVLAGAEQVAPP
jgi:hypothetical protein